MIINNNIIIFYIDSVYETTSYQTNKYHSSVYTAYKINKNFYGEIYRIKIKTLFFQLNRFS